MPASTMTQIPPQPSTGGWGSRLAALDAASVRLANKTDALNQLLKQLQHAAKKPTPTPISSQPIPAAAPIPGSSTFVAQQVQRITTPPRPNSSFSSGANANGLSSTSSSTASSIPAALNQIQALQKWLTQLSFNLEYGEGPRATASSSSSSTTSPSTISSTPAALSALSQLYQIIQQTPINTSSANHISPNRRASALVTIQPLNTASSLGVVGVPVPKGTAFVNGRWIRAPKNSPAKDGGAHSDSNESDEESDPFGDISDHDMDGANGGPGVSTPPEQPVRQSNIINFSSPEGEASAAIDPSNDIDEADVADINFAQRRKSKSKSGPITHEVDADDDEDEDPFADIDDLKIDPAEEEFRRKSELARSHKVLTGPKARQAKNASKTATLRKDVFKHMNQDHEFGDADADEEAIVAKVGKPKHGTGTILLSPKPNAAGNHKSPPTLPISSNAAKSKSIAPEVSAGVAAPISSPPLSPPLNSRFTPHLPKSAPGVTALTTRREGQEIPEENWPEMEVDEEKLVLDQPKEGSQINLIPAAIVDRPDDLDGLDDDDEEGPASQPQPPVHPLSKSSAHLVVPSPIPSRPGSKSPIRPGRSPALDPSEIDDGDFHTPEPSVSHHKGVLSSGSSHHHYSSSGGSAGSSAGEHLHGQLAHAFSDDDDMDQLDDMLDEDEDEHSKRVVQPNLKANTDRATRNLNEFELSGLRDVFQQSELHRHELLGHLDLSSVPILKQPVSEAWLEELATLLQARMANGTSSASSIHANSTLTSSMTAPSTTVSSSSGDSGGSSPKKGKKKKSNRA